MVKYGKKGDMENVIVKLVKKINELSGQKMLDAEKLLGPHHCLLVTAAALSSRLSTADLTRR